MFSTFREYPASQIHCEISDAVVVETVLFPGHTNKYFSTFH